RGVLVALGLDEHIQNLALGVDGAPEIDHAPIEQEFARANAPGNRQMPRRVDHADIGVAEVGSEFARRAEIPRRHETASSAMRTRRRYATCGVRCTRRALIWTSALTT